MHIMPMSLPQIKVETQQKLPTTFVHVHVHVHVHILLLSPRLKQNADSAPENIMHYNSLLFFLSSPSPFSRKHQQ
jgi:hypothetical protein